MSSSVDGRVGSHDISEHFANVYMDLYQQHTLGAGFDDMNRQINSKIDQNLLGTLDRVNYDTVKAALNKLKVGKSDPTFSFSSDCLLNAGDGLINHVTNLFQ